MKYTTVSIPEPLNKKIQKVIKSSGFASSSSFVAFVLREVLTDRKDENLLSDKERIGEKVKAQLEALGYLKRTK